MIKEKKNVIAVHVSPQRISVKLILPSHLQKNSVSVDPSSRKSVMMYWWTDKITQAPLRQRGGGMQDTEGG